MMSGTSSSNVAAPAAVISGTSGAGSGTNARSPPYTPKSGDKYDDMHTAEAALKNWANNNGFTLILQRTSVNRRTLICEHGGTYTPKKRGTKKLGCKVQINIGTITKTNQVKITRALLHHNHPIPVLEYMNKDSNNDAKNDTNATPSSATQTAASNYAIVMNKRSANANNNDSNEFKAPANAASAVSDSTNYNNNATRTMAPWLSKLQNPAWAPSVDDTFEDMRAAELVLKQWAKRTKFSLIKTRASACRRTYTCEHGGFYVGKNRQRNTSTKKVNCKVMVNLVAIAESKQVKIGALVTQHNHPLPFLSANRKKNKRGKNGFQGFIIDAAPADNNNNNNNNMPTVHAPGPVPAPAPVQTTTRSNNPIEGKRNGNDRNNNISNTMLMTVSTSSNKIVNINNNTKTKESSSSYYKSNDDNNNDPSIVGALITEENVQLRWIPSMHDRFIDMENAERIIRKWAHRAGFLLVRKRKSSTRRTLICERGGKYQQVNRTRKTYTKKIGCKALINLATIKKSNQVRVSKIFSEHNHPLPACDYRLMSGLGDITTSMMKTFTDLHLVEASMQAIQEKFDQLYHVYITPALVAKLRRRVRGQPEKQGFAKFLPITAASTSHGMSMTSSAHEGSSAQRAKEMMQVCHKLTKASAVQASSYPFVLRTLNQLINVVESNTAQGICLAREMKLPTSRSLLLEPASSGDVGIQPDAMMSASAPKRARQRARMDPNPRRKRPRTDRST